MSLSGFPRFLHAFPRTDYVTATKPPSQAARDVSRDARTASRRWGPLVTDKDFALAVLDKMFQLWVVGCGCVAEVPVGR
jgi:ribosomal protein L28